MLKVFPSVEIKLEMNPKSKREPWLCHYFCIWLNGCT
jgi:hypothetical protein